MKMKKILNFIFNPNSSINDLALLIMRIIPSYYMFFDHGKGKILNSSRWEGLGSSLTKYLNDSFEPINIFFGFAASFAESICAIFIFFGFLTKPSSFLLAFTMFVAAMKHVTGTGSPESAFIYFSIYASLLLLGPGKISVDYTFYGEKKLDEI